MGGARSGRGRSTTSPRMPGTSRRAAYWGRIERRYYPPRRAVRRRRDAPSAGAERHADRTTGGRRWRVGRWRPARSAAAAREARGGRGEGEVGLAWAARALGAGARRVLPECRGLLVARVLGRIEAPGPGAQSVRGAREPVGQTSPSMAARCGPRHRAPRPRAEKWSLSGLNSARTRARSPTDGAGTPSPLAAPSAGAATPHERRSGTPPTPHDRGRHVSRGPVASRSTAPATCDARGRRGEGEVGLPRAARALGQALDDFSPNAGEFSSH